MAADDDEVPFRLSLFLPAPGDTPSMRGMKYAVIGMGIVLILGFLTIIARIVYLTSRMDASAMLPSGDIALPLPVGAEVRTMSLSGNRLAVHTVEAATGQRHIVVIDLGNGQVVNRIALTTLAGRDGAAPSPGARPATAPGGR